MQILLVTNLFATLAMVGLIWFVQVVHYPMFRLVGAGEFSEYMRRHQRQTTFVVGPLMLTEALTAAGLVYRHPEAIAQSWMWLGVALVFVIWLSTAFLQVPRHGALTEQGYSERHHSMLVLTNWVRTVAWTVRGLLMTAVVYRSLPA